MAHVVPVVVASVDRRGTRTTRPTGRHDRRCSCSRSGTCRTGRVVPASRARSRGSRNRRTRRSPRMVPRSSRHRSCVSTCPCRSWRGWDSRTGSARSAARNCDARCGHATLQLGMLRERARPLIVGDTRITSGGAFGGSSPRGMRGIRPGARTAIAIAMASATAPTEPRQCLPPMLPCVASPHDATTASGRVSGSRTSLHRRPADRLTAPAAARAPAGPSATWVRRQGCRRR